MNRIFEDILTPEEAERLRVTEKISLYRLRELADADAEGRVVVLPVAVDGIAETSAGQAIVKNWDVVARVTFCEPLNEGKYWGDKYADFDISDMAPASLTDSGSWPEPYNPDHIRDTTKKVQEATNE